MKNKKICTQCKLEKEISDFSFSDAKRGYKQSKCKKCIGENTIKYRKNNSEHYKEQCKNNSKRFRENHPLRSIQWYVNDRYKVSVETLNEFINSYIEKNGKVCAICGKEFDMIQKRQYKGAKRLVIDHSHSTGKLRGLLCDGCNLGLGGFKDNIESLQNAINYLKTNN